MARSARQLTAPSDLDAELFEVEVALDPAEHLVNVDGVTTRVAGDEEPAALQVSGSSPVGEARGDRLRGHTSRVSRRLLVLLAPAVIRHVGLHVARYRGAHDEEGPGWISWDGEQIASFEPLPYQLRIYPLANELRGLGLSPDEAWDKAISTRASRRKSGTLTQVPSRRWMDATE